ncbi:hypothetical protein CLOSTHATH_04963 [Hungatella hathewayi DSM 13479]|uniref:Uncharacterized protein n=1 Tax=Hungatella hathewayi DSM 13479 TaxID=566550 RepID=D3AMW3_9FIRM|nr:hypothetical protein CLOSTHATH_04963 [Hungatella hathewayi DSM 13479]
MQDFSKNQGKCPNSLRSDRWTFPLNEKFCALRTANALQSHRKDRANRSTRPDGRRDCTVMK